MQGNAQIVFIDTPGILVAKRPLERAMVPAAWASVEDADVALVIHDPGGSQIFAETRPVIEGLTEARSEVVPVHDRKGAEDGRRGEHSVNRGCRPTYKNKT